MRALECWQAATGITDRPLFRHIWLPAPRVRDGEPLPSPASANRDHAVKRGADRPGARRRGPAARPRRPFVQVWRPDERMERRRRPVILRAPAAWVRPASNREAAHMHKVRTAHASPEKMVGEIAIAINSGLSSETRGCRYPSPPPQLLAAAASIAARVGRHPAGAPNIVYVSYCSCSV
jgi:hypothetical protein